MPKFKRKSKGLFKKRTSLVTAVANKDCPNLLSNDKRER